MKPLFSIVLPIYKNEQNLPVTIPYILERVSLFEEYDVEIILVNDGSPDNSYEVMKKYQKKYPKYLRLASLSKNFGQGAAVSCGMHLAKGDVIGVISADLQDPFELFKDMLMEIENGYDMVLGVRESRPEKGISGLASKTYHHILNHFVNGSYPKGGFDFFVISRKMADEYLKLDIPNASMQLLLLWMGYRVKEFFYVRQERKLGKSSWNFRNKLNVAIGGIVSYSIFPLRMISMTGIFLFLLGCFLGIWGLVMCFMGLSVPLLAGFFALFSFFTGIVLCSLGIVTEYIWRVFDLVKKRPRYILDEVIENKESNRNS